MRHEYAVHAGVYEDTKEWAAQIKADWVRNNFFALRKY